MVFEPSFDACRSLSTGTNAKPFPSSREGAYTSSVLDASCSFVFPPIEDSMEGELVSLDIGVSLLLLFSTIGQRFLCPL
jgi:hypothetical protein